MTDSWCATLKKRGKVIEPILKYRPCAHQITKGDSFSEEYMNSITYKLTEMGFPICSNFIFKTVLHKHSQVGFLWFDFFCSDILCLINPGMLNPIPRNENMTVLHAPEQVERVGFFRFLPGSFCGSVRPPS